MIMYEETLYHKTSDGTLFSDLLRSRGIVVGIKVDKGVVPIAGCDGETVTQGIDDLHKRCAAYYKAGARFAKWYVCVVWPCTREPDAYATAVPPTCFVPVNARVLGRGVGVCGGEVLRALRQCWVMTW